MLLELKDYLLPCLNKKFFGVDCLGCGFQRALLALLEGDFIAAFKLYPAIYPLLFLVGYVIANFFFKFENAQKVIRYLVIITIFSILIPYFIKMIL